MPDRLMVWWLFNEQANDASLGVGAPDYIRDQLRDRRGRNGRGRLWVAPQFGKLKLPRLSDNPSLKPDFLPGGIVIKADDARYCIGGRLTAEELVPEEA